MNSLKKNNVLRIINNFFNKTYHQHNTLLKIPKNNNDFNILFLHHSTGRIIWEAGIKLWFKKYNKINKTNYQIYEQDFPKKTPYGWKNYPYDYWNLWVNNQGDNPYKNEPTLELITKKYDLIIWKHCFPVSNIIEDSHPSDISSEKKTLGNYKLQYHSLKQKMQLFEKTKFIVWTIPALVENNTNEKTAIRANNFYQWVTNEWDEKGDNIFLWDFYKLETKNGLYLKNEYAKSKNNSHPNENFAKQVFPLLCQRIIDVIEGKGDSSQITGETN